MDSKTLATLNSVPAQLNGDPVLVKDVHGMENANQEQALSDTEDDKDYEEQIRQFKLVLQDFRKELLEVFHKSQETFEKQLSYIAAGSLSLSIGFIQTIVNPLKSSHHKWMLIVGWAALIITLLINLFSHFVAGWHAKKGAKEAADYQKYDEKKIKRRAAWITGMNISTVITLTGGIVLIVWYIILNALL